jgi:regulator of RNase E activity RraA
MMSISESTLRELNTLDTCTVANAIDTLDVRLRNEGYCTTDKLCCHYPALPPMVGFAVTLRVRSGNPPMAGGTYLERTDWWAELERLPRPHVLVIEDMDQRPGTGAFVGEVHAHILKSLGCVGVVTNGAVRALHAVQPLGLQLYSGTVSPAHAYIHVVHFETPVKVAGLQIRPGDLLHGDQHGVIRVPKSVAEQVPEAAARLQAEERRIIAECQNPNTTPAQLAELLRRRRL